MNAKIEAIEDNGKCLLQKKSFADAKQLGYQQHQLATVLYPTLQACVNTSMFFLRGE